MRQTTILKAEDVKKDWYVIDAAGQNLGRLATKVANIIRGKHKATFTPNVDCGDYVIIINAAQVVYTGDQEEKKIYYHHSMFPGGLKKRRIGLMRKSIVLAILLCLFFSNFRLFSFLFHRKRKVF